ncbi:PREDICTED: glycerol-3-phosphate acyltransferase 1, mitochondrial isoform X2 [Polistes dominula]|nr:PREDICTED: glycerol-3-phosphate acyltransferase 1, mitochondrial isoform X2 [Polistes dominula]
MVDVLFMRLQEVYVKWEKKTERMKPKIKTEDDGLIPLKKREDLIPKCPEDNELLTAAKYNKMSFDELPISCYEGTSSLLRNCCTRCTMTSSKYNASLVNQQCRDPYGVSIMTIDSGPGLFSKLFGHLSHVYNVKTYHYPRLTETVLNNERLKEAIKLAGLEMSVKDQINEKTAFIKAQERAKMILLDMESKISNVLLKIVAWVLYKLLPCFTQSAIVYSPHIEMLTKAKESGLPLIFLPLHRSHLDYVMISFILLKYNIRNPLIAAGDNLKIPIIGRLLRGLGAFFIKRRIDSCANRKDVLYRAILHTYITESLRAGHNMEFFVEGGRTRTGKPCMPKGGILSVIVDANMDGTIEDALIIPTAMNYERLVDGNFVREQLGQPKKMETFGSTIKAMWSTLMGNYGIIKINFCQPFSLKEMVKSVQELQQKQSRNSPREDRTLKYTISNSSLYGTDFVVEEHRQLVDKIARHVVYDCSKYTPIMSTNVVACLLLNKFRNGCSLDKLVESFDEVREDFKDDDLAFTGQTIDIINHALDILGPGLIKQQEEEIIESVNGQNIKSNVVMVYPVTILSSLIELSYYSNTMLPYYAIKSAIVTVIGIETLPIVTNSRVTLTYKTFFKDVVVKKIIKLCDILRYELIFCKPCETLEFKIDEAIDELKNSLSIKLDEESYVDIEKWSRRCSKYFDDSSDEECMANIPTKPKKYSLDLTPLEVTHMEFLHAILRPLIDTYSYSALTLKKLIGKSLSERDLIKEVSNEIQTNLDNGRIVYGESLCVDPIKNSFKLFEKWDILECIIQDNVKKFRLKSGYNTNKAIETLYQDIAIFQWFRNTK